MTETIHCEIVGKAPDPDNPYLTLIPELPYVTGRQKADITLKIKYSHNPKSEYGKQLKIEQVCRSF